MLRRWHAGGRSNGAANPTNSVLTPYMLLLLQAVELTRAAVEGIRASGLMAHVELLASRELEGRAAGTWGGMVAARYVATRFLAAGLSLPPGRKTFEQRLDGKLVRLAEGSELEIV